MFLLHTIHSPCTIYTILLQCFDELFNHHQQAVDYHDTPTLDQSTLTQNGVLDAKPDLPTGWTSLTDVGSGKTLYLNEYLRDMAFTLIDVFKKAATPQLADFTSPMASNTNNGLAKSPGIVGPTHGIPAVASQTKHRRLLHDDSSSGRGSSASSCKKKRNPARKKEAKNN
jgi:hypothetical protein